MRLKSGSDFSMSGNASIAFTRARVSDISILAGKICAGVTTRASSHTHRAQNCARGSQRRASETRPTRTAFAASSCVVPT